MSKISKLKKSRADWKEKAVDRTKTIKYQKAELKRIKKERDEYKAQFQKTKQELEKEQKKHVTHPKQGIVGLHFFEPVSNCPYWIQSHIQSIEHSATLSWNPQNSVSSNSH